MCVCHKYVCVLLSVCVLSFLSFILCASHCEFWERNIYKIKEFIRVISTFQTPTLLCRLHTKLYKLWRWRLKPWKQRWTRRMEQVSFTVQCIVIQRDKCLHTVSCSHVWCCWFINNCKQTKLWVMFMALGCQHDDCTQQMPLEVNGETCKYTSKAWI